MTFRVQKSACTTCIYRKDSPLDLAGLEAEISDGYGGFNGHRICHHSEDVCCRGFWNRHKDQGDCVHKLLSGRGIKKPKCRKIAKIDSSNRLKSSQRNGFRHEIALGESYGKGVEIKQSDFGSSA